MWSSVRSQTVPYVGDVYAAFLGSFISLRGVAFAPFCVRYAIVEAHGTAGACGRADWFGGSVVDSVSLELPISADIAEILAEPAKDGCDCLGFWRGFGTPCVCELGFCVQL